VRYNLESEAVTKAWAELNSRECDASPFGLMALVDKHRSWPLQRNTNRTEYRTLRFDAERTPHQSLTCTPTITVRKENYSAFRSRRVFTMAAMMPSASTAPANPYDDDALERDLIDPDDGA
jgi:hypothetical protein